MLLPYLGISSGWGDVLKEYIYNAGAYQLEVYIAVGSNISPILILGFLILFIFVFTSLILITAK